MPTTYLWAPCREHTLCDDPIQVFDRNSATTSRTWNKALWLVYPYASQELPELISTADNNYYHKV